jgi:hypothetical protein
MFRQFCNLSSNIILGSRKWNRGRRYKVTLLYFGTHEGLGFSQFSKLSLPAFGDFTLITKLEYRRPLFKLRVSFPKDNSAILGYYAASSGNFLPTFRDNPLDPSSGSKNPKGLEEITNTRCRITRKSAVLIYFAAKA